MALTIGSGGLELGVGGLVLSTVADTPPPEGVLQSFTMTNTEDAATSPGLIRIPLTFMDGDMPSGSIPQVDIQGGDEVTAVQFSARATWNSGALKRCVCFVRDSTFSADQARIYDVSAQIGSYNDTPAFVKADVSAEQDLKLDFTNLIKADLYASKSPTYSVTSGSDIVTVTYTSHARSVGDRFIIRDTSSYGGLSMGEQLFEIATTPNADTFTFLHPDGNATSTDSGGSSDKFIWFPNTDLNDHDWVLNTALTTNIRYEEVDLGPIACTFIVTAKVRDAVTTTLDDNLWVRGYLTAWNDGSDTINGNLEYLLSPITPGFDTAGRAELHYDCDLIDDVTTIQAYDAVKHAANGGWAAVRMDDDAQHALPQWRTASQMPTLNVTHDIDYGQRTKLFPPTPLIGASIPALSPQTYIPMHNLGYRRNTDATGSYSGRGQMNQQDITAWIKADAVSIRTARTDAFHALHYGIHFRDTSDRCYSLTMAPKSAGEYDFTGDGLGAAQEAYWEAIDGSGSGGYARSVSSYGRWDVSTGRGGFGSSSHQISSAYGQWLLTGYRHYLDMSMSLALKGIQQKTGATTGLVNRSETARADAWEIPAGGWGAVTWVGDRNLRYLGWASLPLGQVAGTIPDDEKHSNYFKKLVEHNGDYLSESFSYLPTAWSDNGIMFAQDNSGQDPRNFFHLINTVAFRQVHMFTEDPGFLVLAEAQTRFYKARFEMNHHAWAGYDGCERTITNDTDPATSLPHSPTNMFYEIKDGTIAESTDIVTLACPSGRAWTINDKVIFCAYDDSQNSRDVPAEVTLGDEYHVINPTAGTSFQLAATPGGATINFGTDYACSFQVQWADEAASGNTPDGNSYSGMSCTLLRLAHNDGDSQIDESFMIELEAFVSAEDYTGGGGDLHYATRDIT